MLDGSNSPHHSLANKKKDARLAKKAQAVNSQNLPDEMLHPTSQRHKVPVTINSSSEERATRELLVTMSSADQNIEREQATLTRKRSSQHRFRHKRVAKKDSRNVLRLP